MSKCKPTLKFNDIMSKAAFIYLAEQMNPYSDSVQGCEFELLQPQIKKHANQ